jgi:alpha-D-ribose 1-methylphosphonate 5-triphosphate synthase subunit PhnL
VGLRDGVLDLYPMELSGGMKQRVVMVLSTLLDPSLLIADEITSDARDPVHWREVAAARERGACIYHELFPDADAEAPASEDNPIMAEVEPGHLVTCAHVDEEGGCSKGRAARAA